MELLDAALKQGLTPALVVIIYLIIVKIIDTRKETIQTKTNKNIVDSIGIISNFIKNISKNIVDKDKDKCEYAIEDSFNSSAMRLIKFVSNTIVNNHIDTNKESILANIHNIVNAEFYTIYSVLSLYTINDNKVSNYLNKEWMESIEKDIIDTIYNNSFSKEEKIINFMNKITINFQNYITYINNNINK